MENVYYVLFASHTDAMMMDAAFRREKIPAHISPTPYDLQKKAGCGVAILLSSKDIDCARDCIRAQKLPHIAIVDFPAQIDPRRDRFM